MREEKKNYQLPKAIKKKKIFEMLNSLPLNEVKATIWEVMSEYRQQDIATVKNKQTVRPKEFQEVLKRLQFID